MPTLNPLPSVPMTISQAIAREEGFYLLNSRAQRNNNPGNIEVGNFSFMFGGIQGDPRFAIFPSAEAGFDCLRSLLQQHYKGLTIQEAIAKWAPSNENNVVSYVRNVCAWTELQPDTIIDGYILENIDADKSKSNQT